VSGPYEAGQGCLFCRIVAGEVPSREARSSASAYAFYDIRPVAPVHVLVVPREHITDASCLGSEHGQLLAEMMALAKEVAQKEGVAESGYRLVFNVGPGSGSEVPHLHLHVLGGRRLGWPPG